MIEADGTKTQPTLSARVAVQGKDGTWSNATDYVEVPITFAYNGAGDQGNVLQVGRWLSKIKSGGSNPVSDFARRKR